MFVCLRDCFAAGRYFQKGQVLDHRPCAHFAPRGGSARTGHVDEALPYAELMQKARLRARELGRRPISRKRADLEAFLTQGD